MKLDLGWKRKGRDNEELQNVRQMPRQSEGFVRQSEGHLLYKCTPDCEAWKKVRHWGISGGKIFILPNGGICFHCIQYFQPWMK